MPHDFEIKRGLTVGEWLHQEIVDTFHIETDAWAVERVNRVASQLQAGRPAADRLKVVVPWIRPITAFTAPGRWIYVSRRLLERCPDDETAAFVIAHEIAHHDLDHLKLWPDWMPRFAQAKGGAIAVAAFAGLERRLYGPERECDADRHALDLCIAAGYEPQRCLNWFHIMEQVALDLGDQDIVFGPDEESDDELSPEAPWFTKARIWAWQRTRGYLPIRDRRAALLAYLEKTADSAAAPCLTSACSRRAGSVPHSVRAPRPVRTKRNESLCGHELDRPQLMRIFVRPQH